MNRVFNFLTLCLLSISAFGQGYYMQYKISSQGSATGFVTTYAQDGNSRVEMNMTVPGMGAMNTVSLSLKNTPNTIYILNEKSKTYSELSGNGKTDWEDLPQSDYQVSVLGKEKVNGYNSTHVLLKQENEKTGIEMWLTTEIEGYAAMSQVKTRYTGKSNLMKAMQAKGVQGFPVRIKASEGSHDVVMDLVKAEKRNNPASMFSLNGYTKSASSYSGSGQMQDMMKQLQNMTPEEREQWIKKMQEQYQPH